ncbi:hypothetical protein, partial [Pseudomonas sp. DSP3-2-2]|uniref:hypothetical protein n=1 Tax=unclassified Pseudomonas TaxID=196821 RepID=UPI003CE981C3
CQPVAKTSEIQTKAMKPISALDNAWGVSLTATVEIGFKRVVIKLAVYRSNAVSVPTWDHLSMEHQHANKWRYAI